MSNMTEELYVNIYIYQHYINRHIFLWKYRDEILQYKSIIYSERYGQKYYCIILKKKTYKIFPLDKNSST